MNRRGFLEGTLKALAATSLVVTATPEEIMAFASQKSSPVLVQNLDEHSLNEATAAHANVHVGEILYNRKGIPVCVVSVLHGGYDPYVKDMVQERQARRRISVTGQGMTFYRG